MPHSSRCMVELTADEARRIALQAQGFGKRPAKPGLQHLRAVAARLHAIQIDSVNVLVLAHYLPFFARLGAYPRAALDKLTNERYELIESRFAHQASYIPATLLPLFRWRLDASYNKWRKGWRGLVDSDYVAAVEQQVAAEGPLALSDLLDARRRKKLAPHEMTVRRKDGKPYAESSVRWGTPSDGKTVLDGLLAEGRLALAGRRGVERLYDVAERVVPAEIRDAPSPAPEEARTQLVRLAGRALGVATMADLANYFGLKIGEVRVALPALLEDASLEEVKVDGWPGRSFRARDASLPRAIEGRALLGPFDSLTWSRERTRRLFAYEFSFEIYVPEPKRKYGYYVLPFLLNENLVARVDLKADRTGRRLVVPGAYAEAGVDKKVVTAALAAELRMMATWLGLSDIDVGDRGDLATGVRKATS